MFSKFVQFQMSKCSKTFFRICSYIQKMTLNLIQTLKTSIYNQKHTKNTKIHFQKSITSSFFSFQKSILKKTINSKIRFVRWCSWPAFGGPIILVYIYIYTYIYVCIWIGHRLRKSIGSSEVKRGGALGTRARAPPRAFIIAHYERGQVEIFSLETDYHYTTSF